MQAPTAVTGFAIVFDIVNQFGKPYTTVRLDARLLAKLLTESYPAIPASSRTTRRCRTRRPVSRTR